MSKGFYAYPSQNAGIVYSIQNAIKTINQNSSDIHIKDWQDMNVVGKPIIKEICREIELCDLFLCDLTITNFNVLFELGYAIINSKKIWISIDPTLSKNSNLYKELNLLTTIGNAQYTNAENLVANFNAYWNNPDKDNYYERYIKSIARNLDKEPKLFYLKSAIDTNESLALTRRLQHSFSLIVDDPIEVSVRNIEWYIDKVYTSFRVVAHFIDQNRDKDLSQNAKYALVCGMAYGSGRGPLMLAHAPYKSEIDFRDIMSIHKNPNECELIIEEWINENKSKFKEFEDKYRLKRKNAPTRKLKDIDLGEYVAEDEQQKLLDYFIETAFYREAFNVSQYMIYVGRKGTGKTANFLKLSDDLANLYKQETHICKIKPVGYELEGIFRVFDVNLPEDTKHYVIENLWKYLIYSELALDLYKEIINKNPKYISSSEKEFVDYLDTMEYLHDDFSVRMEKTLDRINSIPNNGTDKRGAIVEILHLDILQELRSRLGDLLKDKDKVYILFDNLDKGWQKNQHIEKLSVFLFALLNIVERIVLDFQRNDSRRQNVELILILFLRSDIFAHIIPNSEERDKLRFHMINWRDREVLQRLIEERFLYAINDKNINGFEIWDKYFIEMMDGIPTKEYIVDRILPKPRDAIYLCKQALRHAINRGHSRIEAEDIVSAEKDYSQQTWFTLLAETQAQFVLIEDFLIELVGGKSIVEHNQLEKIAYDLGMAQDVEKIVELLFDSNFLGIETSRNEFEYLYDDNRKRVLEKLAQKSARKTNVRRYEINTPFRYYLELDDV